MNRLIRILVLLLPLTAAAQGNDPARAARELLEKADYRITARLVRIAPDGARTSVPVSIRALGSPGQLRIALLIDSPAAQRQHILFDLRPQGRSRILVAHPGDKAFSELPFDRWQEAPLGGLFSYEDILEPTFTWSGQATDGRVTRGARQCILLRSTPGPADRSHYSLVKNWLDASSNFPVYVEKTIKATGQTKEFTYFGLRQNAGVWSATQIEAKLHGQPGSTLLIIDRGSPHASLTAKDFDPATLLAFH